MDPIVPRPSATTPPPADPDSLLRAARDRPTDDGAIPLADPNGDVAAQPPLIPPREPSQQAGRP
jgi:hypothetical protein